MNAALRVSILGHDGWRDYAIVRERATRARIAWRLIQGDGTEYLCEQAQDGRQFCGCPSSTLGGAKDDCKHLRALRETGLLSERPTPRPPAASRPSVRS